MGRGLLRFRYSTPSENQNTIPIYCPSMLGLHFTHLGWSYYPYTLFPTICCPQLLSNNFTSNSNIFKTSYLSYSIWKHTCLPLYNPSPLFFVNRILVSCRHLYTYPSSPRNYHYSQSRGKSWLIAYHSPERGLIQYGYSFASERWGGISWGNFWENFFTPPHRPPQSHFLLERQPPSCDGGLDWGRQRRRTGRTSNCRLLHRWISIGFSAHSPSMFPLDVWRLHRWWTDCFPQNTHPSYKSANIFICSSWLWGCSYLWPTGKQEREKKSPNVFRLMTFPAF